MAANLKLGRMRTEFEYDWHALRLAAADPPSPADVQAMLGRAREFVLAVDDVVADETATWISDFRTTLESTEQGLGNRGQQ